MKSPAGSKKRKAASDPVERMLDALEEFDATRPEAERIAGYERFMRATDDAAARYAVSQRRRSETPREAGQTPRSRAAAHTR